MSTKISSSNQCTSDTSCFTLTFSESVENDRSMEVIGIKAQHGFKYNECFTLSERFNGHFIHLNVLLGDKRNQAEDACVVVFKNGLQNLFNIDPTLLFNEQAQLSMDKKCFMYGRVVNKHARWNACFATEHQDPDYANKKGTVYAFDEVPITKQLREKISTFGENFTDLFAEGNYYYDVKKCYIGWHGDTERKKVVGVRLGATFPLHFRWYEKGNPTDKQITLNLEPGDMYIMSEKATGQDWKHRSVQWTLRHSAGDVK